QQSHGIEQVNVAVTQMDEEAQHNAALVEEAAAATQSLEEQSRQLMQTMAAFKVTQLA
ncbi:methyl-accepting chemotaxis protein, partial [Erwinia amylovora]|nr:methyl-accepting chemotaxis protein [Erwinia amylovora]